VKTHEKTRKQETKYSSILVCASTLIVHPSIFSAPSHPIAEAVSYLAEDGLWNTLRVPWGKELWTLMQDR